MSLACKKKRQEVRQTILGTEEAPQVIAIGAGWRGELLEQADDRSTKMCSRGHTTILKTYPFLYLQAQIRCGRSGAKPVKQRPRRMNPNYAERRM